MRTRLELCRFTMLDADSDSLACTGQKMPLDEDSGPEPVDSPILTPLASLIETD